MDEEESFRTPYSAGHLPAEPDKSEVVQSETHIHQPRSEQQNRAWSTMRWFEGTAKIEADFYTRFQELPDEDTTFLKCFYDITDDFELFKIICKFWNVSLSGRRKILECRT
ncbi:MAG: hypothetical protein JSW66_11245 [Phycisphaerales bacterium]|nr:MAG: hypothetical protein JSW66_11245 [Phycisphaerales bacterium]